MLIKDVVVANAYPLFVRWHACADNAADDAEHEQAKKLFFASARVSWIYRPFEAYIYHGAEHRLLPHFWWMPPPLMGEPTIPSHGLVKCKTSSRVAAMES